MPNKGKAVYSAPCTMRRFLLDNGWEFVGSHRRNTGKVYLRAPLQAESFAFDVGIPNDAAVLRFAREAIAYCEQTGERRYGGKLGLCDAEYYRDGTRSLDGPNWPEEMLRRECAPTLHVSMWGIRWGTDLWWLDGLDQPPTWDRREYFSALVPGLFSRGELLSDLEAIHAAELKRYEEIVASQSDKTAD